jgi:hypothetical protein
MLPRSTDLLSDPQLVKKDVYWPARKQRSQPRSDISNESARVKAVVDELQADPIGRESFQPSAATGHALFPRECLREAQQAWRLDRFCHVRVVQCHPGYDMAATFAFLSQQTGVVANAIAFGLETTRKESDFHELRGSQRERAR